MSLPSDEETISHCQVAGLCDTQCEYTGRNFSTPDFPTDDLRLYRLFLNRVSDSIRLSD